MHEGSADTKAGLKLRVGDPLGLRDGAADEPAEGVAVDGADDRLTLGTIEGLLDGTMMGVDDGGLLGFLTNAHCPQVDDADATRVPDVAL